MTELEKLYVEALRESSRSFQTWMAWAIGASLSLVVFTLSPPPPEARAALPIPGAMFTVSRAGAEFLAITVYIVAAILAASTFESVRRARMHLRNSPELLEAASLFPSFATFSSRKLRVFVGLLPWLLLVLAAGIQNSRSATPADWINLALGLFMLGAPYWTLAAFLAQASVKPEVRTF